MRFLAALAALVLLSGCETQPGKPGEDAAFRSADKAQAFVRTGSGFDYRYAFRLPGDRVKEVLQSNADACDKLGPARCRISGMRYSVSEGSHTQAVLTFTIDPTIARNFGDAAVKTLQSADGRLVDSEISGTDATASARTLAIVGRLRDRLKAAQSLPPTDPTAKAQVQKIQSALDTIAESEAGQAQTLATAPVLITYESSSALSGIASADANFRNAGASLEDSVSRVLIVLASVGPWILALIVIIVLLRFAVHGGSSFRATEPDPEQGYEPQHDRPNDDNRNLIQRWFSRDEEPREHERV